MNFSLLTIGASAALASFRTWYEVVLSRCAAPPQTYSTDMNRTGSRALLAGAIFSAVAALLHVGCLVFGAPWYRFLGAGERMARMAARGHWYPPVVTTAIICVLSVWALYASSGAGLIRKLPFLRIVLFAIGAVYLLRGLSAAVLVPYFPGNSLSFWLVTSAASTVAGVLHLIGLKGISSKQ